MAAESLYITKTFKIFLKYPLTSSMECDIINKLSKRKSLFAGFEKRLKKMKNIFEKALDKPTKM